MNNTRKAVLFAILAVVLWSTAATAFKISLKEFDFPNLLFYSSLISTVVLFIILLTNKNIQLVEVFAKKALLHSAILGFINPFLYYMILLKAYSLLPAQIAQPLNYLWPVMLSLLAVPMLKQPLGFKGLIAMLISFAGVAVISQQGTWFSIKNEDLTGIFLASGSSIVWAVYWLLNIRDKRQESSKLFLNFLFGTLYVTIYLLCFGHFQNPLSNSRLASVYVGLFEMGITFYLWMMALKYAPSAARISNIVFMSPFLSLIFIHFFLHEKIYATTIPGIILILAGIFVSRIRFARMK
ncbi:MAG: hypothetical protein CVU05_09685 [Bacteroidetes bacterium HGW-Bacteroidetes-21]|jgi:drug/metabolite transporter (DMT)-like permease|nr:MAG: hypothetical protein CVU05_09685 [Bacteroidetes bacterium HGW-Bacteroidetes-21]